MPIIHPEIQQAYDMQAGKSYLWIIFYYSYMLNPSLTGGSVAERLIKP